MIRLGWRRLVPVLAALSAVSLAWWQNAAAQRSAAAAQHGAAASAAQQPNEERARAAHLLSRATWGVRPEDVDAVVKEGLTHWLDRQLDPARIPDEALASRLASAYPTTLLPMSELLRDYSPQPADVRRLAEMQAMRDSMGDQRARDLMTPEERRQQQLRSPQRLLFELVGAKVQRAAMTERQLEDVMLDFWFNHFNVFFNKGQDRYFVADYERNAIRPHVFGKFEDMLIATAQHPAMLFYLDNWQSVYVDSTRVQPQPNQNFEQLMRRVRNMTQEQKDELVRSGRITREQLRQLESGVPPQMAQQLQQRAQNRGLNENYARELLELHTLGVDGGYTQKDVIEVARAFTGWTFERPGQRQNRQALQQAQRPARPLGRGMIPRGGMQQREQPIVGEGDVPFVFRPELHDRGDKMVLGQRLEGGRGIEDGLDVIRMVSRHPSTARHIATKLVERFVSDAPPPALVNHIADVFLKTNGDLRAVTRALFTADAFYQPEYRGIKVKTPFELVVSAVRVTHADITPSRRLMETLRTMGHLPYTEPAPTGFPAMSEDWVNTGAMLNRMNFGLDLAAGRVDGVRIAAAQQQSAPRARAQGAEPPLDAWLQRILPETETARLAERIREDLEQQSMDAAPRQRIARGLGLALGSPEFQRR